MLAHSRKVSAVESNNNVVWYHQNPGDKIWWVEAPMPKDGEWLFSFDRKTVFNLFADYPWKLTPEQRLIFDRENPYWVEFFKDRQ